MINIGAGSGFRNTSPELRSSARILRFSLRSLRLCGEGESLVLSVPARTGPAAAPQIEAISHPRLPQITRHTMQSNFTRKSLKTNDGHPNKVTHFLKTGLPVSTVSRVWEINPRPSRLRRTKCRFSNPIPESRRSRPASDNVPGGII
jgi:hypothetical protein